METLKLYRGEMLLAQVALGDRPIELGRASGCDLVVDDPEVAERHWLAVRRHGTVMAYDVRSGRRARARHLPLAERVALGRNHSVLRAQEARGSTSVQRDTEDLYRLREPHGELVLVVGQGADARKHGLRDAPVHVGRGPENDLVVPDRAASLQHCRIEPSAGELLVRDLGSCNGTFVNGVRVERALVSGGAHIRVGRTDLRVLARDALGRVVGSSLISDSAPMLALLAQAQRAASLPWPALILGESGSGKEGVAALLHACGPRSGKSLVTVNAGGVPRDLIESELFGHERGAFTGAHQPRRGVFEQADGGTLFLDEIGELPLALQARLLRVLESGEVRRVGAESTRKVDVRVVCATHRDLRAMVAEGSFRQDLYFRIARIVLEVPPLRARTEDLPLLADHFLRELSSVVGSKQLSEQAFARLRGHAWPGNVRELRNVLSAAAFASASARIERAELECALEHLAAAGARGPSLEGLREAVEQHGGNVSAAARALGMSRSTLRDRLKLPCAPVEGD
jgi:DNA-binding NtrC family response regulator